MPCTHACGRGASDAFDGDSARTTPPFVPPCITRDIYMQTIYILSFHTSEVESTTSTFDVRDTRHASKPQPHTLDRCSQESLMHYVAEHPVCVCLPYSCCPRVCSSLVIIIAPFRELTVVHAKRFVLVRLFQAIS
jgi:hypothetical protein